jgi:MFS family permease
MGGTDKNTMIVTVSWLLGLAAGAIGYVVPHVIGSTAARLENPLRIAAVSALGLLLSLVAAYVALLYAGYANRNWAQADMIARKRGWLDLLPEGCAGETTRRKWVAAAAWRLSRPCDPERKLAPVFFVFSFLAIVSGLAQSFFLVWALYATPGLRTGC